MPFHFSKLPSYAGKDNFYRFFFTQFTAIKTYRIISSLPPFLFGIILIIGRALMIHPLHQVKSLLFIKMITLHYTLLLFLLISAQKYVQYILSVTQKIICITADRIAKATEKTAENLDWLITANERRAINSFTNQNYQVPVNVTINGNDRNLAGIAEEIRWNLTDYLTERLSSGAEGAVQGV